MFGVGPITYKLKLFYGIVGGWWLADASEVWFEGKSYTHYSFWIVLTPYNYNSDCERKVHKTYKSAFELLCT